MGHRLSKIYTRTGDDGTTGLGDGHRVRKDHARVEAYGTVDEANSAIGMMLAVPGLPTDVARCLTDVQHDLFDLGGELCIPGTQVIKAEQHRAARAGARRVQRPAARAQGFHPAGRRPGRRRAVTSRAPSCDAPSGACGRWRRAEQVNVEVPQYLNRLSDLLFVIARVLARHEHGTEILWQHDRGSA